MIIFFPPWQLYAQLGRGEEEELISNWVDSTGRRRQQVAPLQPRGHVTRHVQARKEITWRITSG